MGVVLERFQCGGQSGHLFHAGYITALVRVRITEANVFWATPDVMCVWFALAVDDFHLLLSSIFLVNVTVSIIVYLEGIGPSTQ